LSAIELLLASALVGLGALGFGYYHRRKQKKLKLKQAA